jgi:hypothetical protein
MQINIPEIVDQVTAQFYRYEKALMANDVDELNALFWVAEETVRYGPVETLYGHAEIAGFRKARDASDISRELTRTVITTYGTDFATAWTEYRRLSNGRMGRQTQTWARMPEGWRIVAAHVRLLPEPA